MNTTVELKVIRMSDVESKPRSWGGWKVVRGGKSLRHPDSLYAYHVPIAKDAAEALAWVNHMERKSWVTDAMLRGLLVALVQNLSAYPRV